METDAQLKLAQWILERNLGWIAASDAKTGVVAAIDTAMLGALAAAFTHTHAPMSAWGWLFLIISNAFLLISMICAAFALFPRTDGPPKSSIFAKGIASVSAADYVDGFKRAAFPAFLDDCLMQVHRNAQIASTKFELVRKAMGWSFAALLPWVAAIATLT